MNLQGGANSGFVEGSALKRFSAGRWMDVLDKLKMEYKAATQEMSGYRILAEAFHAKVESQMNEMTTMKRAVNDLGNKFLYVKEQYETELHRVGEKVMNQTGVAPSTNLPHIQGHEKIHRNEQDMSSSSIRASLPAISLNYPSAGGGPRQVNEPSLKKLRLEEMGSGLNPGKVSSKQLPGNPLNVGVSSRNISGPLPNVAGLTQPRGLGMGPAKDGKPLNESGFGSESLTKPVPRASHVASTPAPQDTDYNVVQGRASGNLLNMNVKLQNSFAHDSVVCCVRYRGDGEYIATGSNRCAQMFNATTGSLYARFSREDGGDPQSDDSYIRAVCFSPDGHSLITGSEDKLVRIWDVRKRVVRNKLSGHESDIYAVEASRDGKFIVSGSGDKQAKIWHLQSGKLLHTLESGENGPTDGITSVSISSKGNHVAAGSLDKIVRVWDVETGRLMCSFQGHTDSVYSVAFSPDSRTLLSGSLDKTLRLWDLTNGTASSQCKLSFIGHKDYVLSVAFSPNGRLLLSGSKDHTVQFWDPRQPHMCLMLQGHKNSVISIAHSPVNKMFATGSGDSRARTWAYTN